jgi:catechol 2,3-dioxygenase-like lactoylglutathione lyase family enzyme
VLKRLSHVCLGSTDLERTVRFYSDLIGCEVAHEFRNPAGERYGVFLSCRNGTFLEFFNEQSSNPPGGLFRHVCFEVEDIEGMAQAARNHGLTADVKRGRTDRILQFFVHDPDGNMIEFQQHDRESVLYPLLAKVVE